MPIKIVVTLYAGDLPEWADDEMTVHLTDPDQSLALRWLADRLEDTDGWILDSDITAEDVEEYEVKS